MIGSPRWIAITAANEKLAMNAQYGKPHPPEENPVADAAIRELAEYRAQTAESKLEEIYQTCVRCRQNQCSMLWNDMRVCELCCQILTEKYDRQPADARGTYTEGFMHGKRAAFFEAADWVREAMLQNQDAMRNQGEQRDTGFAP